MDEWKHFVVLVESSTNVWGKPSKIARRIKETLVLSAKGTDGAQLFSVINRKDLLEKGKEDPKSLAATLKQIIKQDKVRGIARKQQHGKKKQLEETKIDQTNGEETALNSALQNLIQKIEDDERQKLIEEELVKDSLNMVSSEEELNVARSVLEISNERAQADIIYILDQYPSTPEEAAALIASTPLLGTLDAVVEIRGGAYDEPYKAPARPESTLSNYSYEDPKNGVWDDREHTVSTSSLPSLSMLLKRHSLNEEENLSKAYSSSSLFSCKDSMRNALAPEFSPISEVSMEDIVGQFKLARSRAKSPGWKNVAFLEIDLVDHDKPSDHWKPMTVLSTFAELVQNTACEKYRFQVFLKGLKNIQIPKRPVFSKHDDTILEIYHTACDGVKSHSLFSVPLCLDMMALAIETVGDISLVETALLQKSSNESIKVIQYGDDASTRFSQASSETRVDGSFAMADKRSWARCSVPGGGSSLRNRRKPSELEIALENDQFHGFCAFNEDRIRYIRTIREFETIMHKMDPKSTCDFSNRVLRHNFEEQTLAQVMYKAMTDNPHIQSKYIQQRDEMLVVLYQETPVGRRSQVIKSAFAYTNLSPSFDIWPELDPRKIPMVFNVDFDPIAALETVETTFYPSDQSFIRLVKTASSSWCTISKYFHTLGLRKSASSNEFYANFEDESMLEIHRGGASRTKPDKLGFMMSNYRCLSGLLVSHNSDGTIVMHLPHDKTESHRVVLGNGVIVSFATSQEDWKRKHMYPNGSVTTYMVDGSINTRSFVQGGNVLTISGKESSHAKDPVIVMIDPSTQAVVLDRESDGTRFIRTIDETFIATFADGTLVESNENEYRIETPGMATIKIFRKIETASASHSKGARSDISSGGKRIRSSTLLPDATVVHIEYDTRVTAKINGHLKILKPDGSAVIVSDDGGVVYRPCDVDAKQHKEEQLNIHPDAKEVPNENIGCFLFNCDRGSVAMTDWEHNQFYLDNVTNKAVIKVELSGDCNPIAAIVNSIIEPRLFMMKPDGRGFEFVTEQMFEFNKRNLEKSNRSKFSAVNRDTESCKSAEETKWTCVKSGRSANKARDIPVRRVEAEESTLLLPVCIPLPQLHSIVVPRVALEISTTRNGQAVSPPKSEPINRPVECFLLCDYTKFESVTLEERKEVLQSESEYAQWKQNVAADEGKYNVDDRRTCDIIEQQQIMQKAIMQERKRIEKKSKHPSKPKQSFASPEPMDSVVDSTLLNFLPSPEMSEYVANEEDNQLPQNAVRPPAPNLRREPLGKERNYWNT